VYLDDLLEYIIAPVQDQVPVNLEPQLHEVNLYVNLLTDSTPGRLIALRRAQELNDQVAERGESDPNNSFASQRSAHDLNGARRREPQQDRPDDRYGHKDPMRDEQHPSSHVMQYNLDKEELEKSYEGGVCMNRQPIPEYSPERQSQPDYSPDSQYQPNYLPEYQRDEKEDSDTRGIHTAKAYLVDRRRDPRSDNYQRGKEEDSLTRGRRLYPILFPQPRAQPVVQAVASLHNPNLGQMIQELFLDSGDDDYYVKEGAPLVNIVTLEYASNSGEGSDDSNLQLKTATQEVNHVTDNVDIDPLELLHNRTGCTSTGRLIEAYI
jgi:hypothetical protein